MIAGGSVTVYVSNMDQAVRFYTETLGLKLQARWGDHYAQVDAGPGLMLGLHPASPTGPKPGTEGSISIGLLVTQPLEEVISTLTGRGVSFRGPILEDTGVRLALFGDPDGNSLYLAQPAW